ncbi:olfactory receptor 5AP2-like [Pleurodeles waltl]|uniref:olfactory receptor 5AP2-like n=1 Tax=Pleurodeles waltl TaxID=8319 RepID=UPI0037097ED4
MDINNGTQVSEFILLGFSDDPKVQIGLFSTFTVTYMITVIGNLLLVILTWYDAALTTPMYVFLCNLSLMDLCFSTVTVPKMLSNFLAKKKSISFVGCFVQLYFFHFIGSAECFLLTIMSFDRYVAICCPLRYMQVMSRHVCFCLASASWISGFLFSFGHTSMTVTLSYCGPNQVNHFFCDIPPLLQLSCSDVHSTTLEIFIFGGMVAGGSFLLTLTSYICIITAILKIKSASGRQKTFSTCAAHLIVVSIFFSTILFMYLRPKSSYSMDQDKVLSVLYNVLTPLLNPMIYSFRNNEVKVALKKCIRIGLLHKYPR